MLSYLSKSTPISQYHVRLSESWQMVYSSKREDVQTYGMPSNYVTSKHNINKIQQKFSSHKITLNFYGFWFDLPVWAIIQSCRKMLPVVSGKKDSKALNAPYILKLWVLIWYDIDNDKQHLNLIFFQEYFLYMIHHHCCCVKSAQIRIYF